MHQLAEAQTDLATVRDAMEATDEALAQKEQEAAYMVDGEMLVLNIPSVGGRGCWLGVGCVSFAIS